MSNEWQIILVKWQERQQELADIRYQVFVREQAVPEDEEWDGRDDDALHWLVQDGDQPIACARVLFNRDLASGKLGRMAVRTGHRAKGVGTALVSHVIRYARREGWQEIFLDAQTDALSFYQRLGFLAEGPEFQDADIPHRRMRLPLQADAVLRLSGPAECLDALSSIGWQARRSIDILSEQLSPALYSHQPLADAISALARRNRHSHVRVLVRDTRPLGGRPHPLVQLAQRLPSHIEIRALREMPRDPDMGYLSADRQGLVYLTNEREQVGFINREARAECRRLLEEFDHLWAQHSAPDPNLKALYI